jgi:hypothetical protein
VQPINVKIENANIALYDAIKMDDVDYG